MSKNWYPIIDESACIECGTCVEFCKHGVYDKSSSRPIVIYREGCIEGCHGCANLCPAEAITYHGDVKKEEPCCGSDSNCGCNTKGGCGCS